MPFPRRRLGPPPTSPHSSRWCARGTVGSKGFGLRRCTRTPLNESNCQQSARLMAIPASLQLHDGRRMMRNVSLCAAQ